MGPGILAIKCFATKMLNFELPNIIKHTLSAEQMFNIAPEFLILRTILYV
jgi:hypothetical protein